MSENRDTPHAITVYCRNNPLLRERGVAFHWWGAEYTSLHNHDHYEFFIILSGKTNHILNGECRELSVGSLMFIHPEDCHQFTPVAGHRSIHINLSVTKEKLAQLCRAIGTDIRHLPKSSAGTVQLSPQELSHFEDCAKELSYLQTIGDGGLPDSMLICHMLIYAVYLLSEKQNRRGDNMPEWMRLLLQRIHMPENLSCRAADVYRMAGYSPPVVIRTFKQYTGQTISAYLTQYKMEIARQMLLATQRTVLDIADQLGYNSVSHFNKVFCKSTGISPGAYRRKFLP